MTTIKYNQLCNDSMTWECMGCFFPSVDTPVRNIGKTRNFDEKDESGANTRTQWNPGLNKRGMKFAHVNVVTLPGHFADVEVLLEKTAFDVFAVTESHLDCTIPDGQVYPSGNVCYRKYKNRNGGCSAVFVKGKWPSRRRKDLECESIEMVCVEICPDKARNTIFGVV